MLRARAVQVRDRGHGVVVQRLDVVPQGNVGAGGEEPRAGSVMADAPPAVLLIGGG